MGSMLEVMKRVQEEGPPTEPPADANGATTATPEAPAPSRFAVGDAADEAGASAAGTTVTWDVRQIDPAVVAFHDRYSSVCEQFRSVRARLVSMNTAGAHRVIAITSSMPQEGKSVSTVNLGLVLAEGGEHRVLIGDADFRRSSIGKMLGLTDRPGLAELIRGDVSLNELLCPTPFPNLSVLPPGRMSGQSVSELLSSAGAREVLARLRATFDYALLDAPPVNTVSDVSMLAPSCDGVILVVEMHRTPEPAAQQAARTLQANNVKILGCILTRHDDRRTHYYDRYYNYYREG